MSLWVNYRPDHLPPPVAMSLNAEPAAPEEREAQHLPPKSYADAAEEALEPPSHANGTDGAAESSAHADNVEKEGAKTNGVGILRIVDVDGHQDDDRKSAAEATQQSPKESSIKDQESYEGTGIDETPKSPKAKTHRKKSSRSSLGSVGRTYGVSIKNDLKSAASEVQDKANDLGKEADGKQETLTQEAHDAREKVDDMLLQEKPRLVNGDALTTVKPPKEAEKDRRIDKPSKRRNSELKAGRQAGAGWAKSKIRFAPMNIPLQRRLQTCAVLMHTLSIVGSLAIFFFLCSIPLLWPILLPYTVYVLFSNAGTSGELSFRSERVRRLKVWSLFASYFPARLHRSQELEPTRKYIFGYHPHGIISHGAFAAFATEALGFSQLFPGITNALLTLDSNFRYPIYREYALRLGMASVSRESCENILSKGGHNGEGMGRAITIVVGGARESLDARPGVIRLVLRRRKGFVKMAIRTGADLVPVLAFGENDIYDQVDSESHPLLHKFQMLVKKFMGFTVPIFHARGIFNYDVGMMPYRRPINIVAGRPIRVVQDKHPSPEYMDEVHEQYIDELMRLWHEHKDTFAKQRTGELEIVE
ncbi:2-acylglycerol O-acyltransferase [Ascochyta rabiei]|uniref:diacylglycerol O-acyltransferase n=1 Tax=Didymella rabiei TaxID=5454 RepID=A0A163ADJ9_DIDRA|nr:2-acylglycerol O-acyltransferase [Ascochyta rabiei]KZM21133.1 transferase [Ascochyta rabiei]UPX17758.1 2-acylglycerol O-acyltransferase [Ascochyta rabiei]